MADTVAEDEKHRLTAVQGLAALSLDALSSVAYGPEGGHPDPPVLGGAAAHHHRAGPAHRGLARPQLLLRRVFVGFTLSQFGLVKHWRTERGRGWTTRAIINGVGAVLTAATTIIELISKFTEGAWLIVLVIPGLVLLVNRVHGT